MASDPPRRPRWKKVLAVGALAVGALYLALLVPDPAIVPPPPAPRSLFAWNQDERWKALEAAFARARKEDRPRLRDRIRELHARGLELESQLGSGVRAVPDPLFDRLEETLFQLGVLVAACPEELPRLIAFQASLRDAIKEQSIRWDMNAPATRERLYRLLYGGRAAVEEAMLQAPTAAVPALTLGRDEPSGSP
ncbi:MAG TPA: hypothetical protein VEN81_12455, partial [Planctomycetota bacterium]|nr:hypothetical protein [Planctomycetota bacterium]